MTYQALAADYCKPDRILLTIMPLATRWAGPREALWYAIISRNYGANYLIIDHNVQKLDPWGRPFYGPEDALALIEKYTNEIGISIIPFENSSDLPGNPQRNEAEVNARNTNALNSYEVLICNNYLRKD